MDFVLEGLENSRSKITNHAAKNKSKQNNKKAGF
jgi:hypothetical protein